MFGRKLAAVNGDERKMIADGRARYFGVVLDDRSLTPGAQARLGTLRFADWLGQSRR